MTSYECCWDIGWFQFWQNRDIFHKIEHFVANRQKQISIQIELEQVTEEIKAQLDPLNGFKQAISYIRNSTITSKNVLFCLEGVLFS